MILKLILKLILILLLLSLNSIECSVIDAYRSLLQTHTLKTNIITASLLTVTSDAITQSIERFGMSKSLVEKFPSSSSSLSSKSTSRLISTEQKHDYYRSFTMLLYGGAVFGAFVTYWFKFLSWLVPVTDFASVVRKVLVNQVFMSPFLNALFFTYVILTRNTTSTSTSTSGTTKKYDKINNNKSNTNKIQLIKKKLATDLLPTIYRSCVFWITLNLINFRFVKANEQVLVTNLGFLIWTIYLSYIGFKKIETI